MWRRLHLIHRWAGIGLGLLVLLWLLSGLVMLFVARPELRAEERQRALAELPAQAQAVSPAQAWAAVGASAPPEAGGLRLQQQLGRPVYLLQTGKRWLAVDGLSGQPRPPLQPAQAEQLAREHAERLTGRTLAVAELELLERDQWTVYSRFNPQRPLYRVALADEDEGLELYIGQASGELLLDTRRWERAWNWLGSVTHWIYITPLRQHTELWRQIILWSSGAAALMCLLGLVLGLQRLRLRRRYASGSVSPYRERWQRWHHLLGLGGGVVLLAWLFSGWLSMGPWGWPGGDGAAAGQERQRWQGASPSVAALSLPELRSGVVELEALRFQSQTWWLARLAQGSSELIAPGGQVLPQGLSEAQLRAAAQAMRPQQPLVQAQWLHEADLHYYPLRHHPRDFPVYRLQYQDGLLLYLDPRSARIALRVDAAGRWNRWLFNALHRWDLPPLHGLTLARDALVIALSLAGLALTAAGTVLGWRRLRGRRPLPSKISSDQKAQATP
ncbi:PepSY domain-containing protein [Roseateles sp.]|uniref:PepSY domain-containing protein n=1 Tax=Roseateles sp. TaxID=1971397 RepID=UPI003D0C584F